MARDVSVRGFRWQNEILPKDIASGQEGHVRLSRRLHGLPAMEDLPTLRES